MLAVWPDQADPPTHQSDAARTPAATDRATTAHSATLDPAPRPKTQPPAPTLVPAEPAGLRIPALDIDAAVTPIEAADGTLLPPSDYTTVGWWASGAMPGSAAGTTLLTGHTVHTGGGALDDLEYVEPGDRVIIERTGPDLAYVVTTVKTYRKGTLAEKAGKLFTQDGPGRLAVVTCEDYNGSIYLSNVVVIATDPRPLDQ